MSLFNDSSDLELDTPKQKRRRKKYTPLNSLKLRLALFKEFTKALKQRDKHLLNFLLSDNQESKHWTTKQDFVEKYLTTCKNFESKQAISVTVRQGIGLQAKLGWRNGVAIVVDSTKSKERLWRFDLLFNIDNFGKLKISKAKIIFPVSAFKGQLTNEFFRELPHSSCSPPKPNLAFK